MRQRIQSSQCSLSTVPRAMVPNGNWDRYYWLVNVIGTVLCYTLTSEFENKLSLQARMCCHLTFPYNINILIKVGLNAASLMEEKSAERFMEHNPEKLRECQGCMSVFDVFNRRHHCRVCDGTFCGKCSNRRLPGYGRACQTCFDKHQNPITTHPKGVSAEVLAFIPISKEPFVN